MAGKVLQNSRVVILEGLKSRSRNFSTSLSFQKNYKLVVVGGGAGGCAVAAKFVRKLGAGNVAVIEPSQTHYYQPMFTLVGGGIKTLSDTARPMKSVLPAKCDWIESKAVQFDPVNQKVTTASGEEVGYDYLVVAMGLQLNFNKIKGLPEAFDLDPQVVSNYWTKTVVNTYPAIQRFKGGNAIFTFPNTPIKCAGAPQKIMYLAEELFRKNNTRNDSEVLFNTALGVIFGVKKYAESLQKVIDSRNIKVNYKRNLVEVRASEREAVFENLDKPGEMEVFKYDMLHVTPPMSTPDELRTSDIVNEAGFVSVNKDTLQHTSFPNIFAIGDCNSAPTSKTAAAVAAQSGVLERNLSAVMDGGKQSAKYDGYTSCPLVTSRGKCILAEFDYDAQPLETFPVNQGKERSSMYQMKAKIMPELYWKLMLNGYWNGPGVYRKMMRLGMSPRKPSA
ncbi:sulfide:quinone oxidoreductase, mitochondrial-like [Mizuhopecten yessoensis]|uniref:Sulfide:quinone oxidoreductase, mitochondrial n=1 Tax=Mizuhopecten yessoensis TaxID=6573 RepID=A0A210QSP6_MIZYE|nr:sulfide:quinone oxidoreductase, mitochondrial-like [Mizuhopecten yessoensis]OWF51728.1 Sulfide:quinone oxidoreductase, mitochondrial [Mizuhopecten yessoensis]